MTLELAAVLGLLVLAIALFAINRPRMDAVALIVLTALPFTGAVTMSESLAGFSDANVVLIAALFVIGDGLVRTGVARSLGDWLVAKAGKNETLLITLLMVVTAILGSFMSSTAVTAIFIPVALRITQMTGVPAGQVMMPLSVAALISGMMTLVATTPNLVVQGELIRQGHKGFEFFSFTPFGVPILVLGIVYMNVARRWLSSRERTAPPGHHRPRLLDWIEDYKLAEREHRVRVRLDSPFVGKTLEELQLRQASGANLVAIERDGTLIQPIGSTRVWPGDILLVDLLAPQPEVDSLQRQYGLEPVPLSGAYFSDRSQEIGMAEVFVPPNSELIGKSLAGAEFRRRYGLNVIGLRRSAAPHTSGLDGAPLKLGDTLLLIGPWKAIRNMQAGGKDVILLNLPAELDDVLPAPGKARQAIACLALVVGLMVSGLIPNVQAALVGCLLMGALGCINLTSAYRAIDWKTIVLIVGMMPFSTALERTGAVELASQGLMTLTQSTGTYGLLAALFLITAILGMFISNTATAILMAPIAIAIATDLEASPYPFAMIVALASSTAFMTPVSSPVNTLVVTPGNYTFGDFLRVGVPFALIVLLVCVFLVPVLLPM